MFAAVFMINSLALAYMGTRSTEAAAQKTILDEAAPAKSGTCSARRQQRARPPRRPRRNPLRGTRERAGTGHPAPAPK